MTQKLAHPIRTGALLALLAATGPALLATTGTASAAPVIVRENLSLENGAVTFNFGTAGSSFTLSATFDIFNPVAIRTTGNAMAESTGSLPGAAPTPSTDFAPGDGSVSYGSGAPFSAFSTTTTIPYSNGGNFFGLYDGRDYGFAYFNDDYLVGYAFDNAAGTAITPFAAVPEPMSALPLIAGIAGLFAWSRRRRDA